MNTREELREVPSFPNVDALIQAQQAKKGFLEADLYFRDGSKLLFSLERQVAKILGVKLGNLLLYNSGMSAVTDALEVTRPTTGTRIFRGDQLYSKSDLYISDDLRLRGASIYKVDAGSVQNIEKEVQLQKPNIIFFETVTNVSVMAVLDVERFLRLPILEDVDPLIILDNTLPTSTAMPLGDIISSSDRRVIVVESGTKLVRFNTDLLGIAYTENADLLLDLKKRRQRTGSLLNISAARTLREVMPKSAKEYDLRNQAIFRHTLRLARACQAAQKERGDFAVVHPNLPDHDNSDYANSRSPGGVSPVFFINPADWQSWQYEIAERLWVNPVIYKYCELGQSFGFDRSRIWPDDNEPTLRISGGIYTEEEQTALDQAFFEVLTTF